MFCGWTVSPSTVGVLYRSLNARLSVNVFLSVLPQTWDGSLSGCATIQLTEGSQLHIACTATEGAPSWVQHHLSGCGCGWSHCVGPNVLRGRIAERVCAHRREYTAKVTNNRDGTSQAETE